MNRQIHRLFLLCAVLVCCGPSCSRQEPEAAQPSAFPVAVDRAKVGEYPALTKSGGGYFYDEVLEYRVWIHADGDDYYHAFATYEEAQAFSKKSRAAEEPLVLVLQREWINEPQPGQYVHEKGERITEWLVDWLDGHRRGPDSIARFLKAKEAERAPDAPGQEAAEPGDEPF
jgi:putative acetyltransferase